MMWGGDQLLDFWLLWMFVVVILIVVALGILNWSYDIGGYFGEWLMVRCLLLLTDLGDVRGWVIVDVYGYGLLLWVALVFEVGACEIEVDLLWGDWIDMWMGVESVGGGTVLVLVLLERTLVWVRRGVLIVMYLVEHVVMGFNDVFEVEWLLEVTLWGELLFGCAMVCFVDGIVVWWMRGEWLVFVFCEILFSVWR